MHIYMCIYIYMYIYIYIYTYTFIHVRSRSREGSLAERACETILAACMGRQGTGRRKGEGEKREARKQRAATQGHSWRTRSSQRPDKIDNKQQPHRILLHNRGACSM